MVQHISSSKPKESYDILAANIRTISLPRPRFGGGVPYVPKGVSGSGEGPISS
jgi:hypothetical protein